MSVLKSDQFVEGADLETPTWVTSYQGLPRTVNVRRCRLEVIAGVDQGKVIELASPQIQIGRLGADLNLADGKVSSLHCELRLTPEGYRLRDLGSTNGTYVNGQRIQRQNITFSDDVRLGSAPVPLSDPRIAGLVVRPGLTRLQR